MPMTTEDIKAIAVRAAANAIDEAIGHFEENQKQFEESHKYGIDINKASEREYVQAGLAYYKREAKEMGFPLNIKTQEQYLVEEYRRKKGKVPEETTPKAETPQEENPCPNLQPMTEWIKGESEECRPCTLGPVVQWYWDELKEQGHPDVAQRLEKYVENLNDDNPDEAILLCEELDKIKSEVPEELKRRLQEFDCAAQLFDPLLEGDADEGESSAPA